MFFVFLNFVLSTSAQTAFNILKDHPQVNPDKIGLFGLCLGSIATINLAAESTIVKASDKCTISWSCFFFSLECVDVKLCATEADLRSPSRFADFQPEKELVSEICSCSFFCDWIENLQNQIAILCLRVYHCVVFQPVCGVCISGGHVHPLNVPQLLDT